MEKGITKIKLNRKQKRFCEYFSSSEEFFGNGVQSYIEAYTPKQIGNWYNSAKSSAFNLLTKPYILEYIDNLLELRGLNNPFVDKQLEFLVTQSADFKSKLGAIREYNQLKKRTEGESVVPIINITVYGDHNSSRLRAKKVSVSVSPSIPEIQDSGVAQESRKIEGGVERTDHKVPA